MANIIHLHEKKERIFFEDEEEKECSLLREKIEQSILDQYILIDKNKGISFIAYRNSLNLFYMLLNSTVFTYDTMYIVKPNIKKMKGKKKWKIKWELFRLLIGM